MVKLNLVFILMFVCYLLELNRFECANVQVLPSFQCDSDNSDSIPNVTISVNIGFHSNGNSKSKNRQIKSDDCGLTLPRRPNSNPSESFEGEFPWFVSIFKANFYGMTYNCDGTLISKNIVITSGVCITVGSVVKPEQLWLFIGAYNFVKATSKQQHRPVEEIIFHPNFDYSSLESDVALLRLVEDVDITDYVRPACLWPDNSPIENLFGKEGTLPGWDYDSSNYITEELSSIPMIVTPKDKCLIRRAGLNNLRKSSASLFCAGFRPRSQTCKGDDGAGLFFKINEIWHVRGFVSCSVGYQDEVACDSNHFVGMTDVVPFLHWIRSNL